MAPLDSPAWLRDLNPAQRLAVDHGTGADPAGPLLILAGAGSGKTNTLAHRVAHLVVTGADVRRILLLTFTRRAAAEMTKRAQRILGAAASTTWSGFASAASELTWAGTFHGVGNRLLRMFADSIGLDPSFTVLDRSDAADLMNLVRQDLGMSDKSSRFPRKDTCLAIYSLVVNAGIELEHALETAFPWCSEWEDELRELFSGYVAAKQRGNTLDYDDLLLWWSQMMGEPMLAAAVSELFDHVLVDEYQDTNALQANILFAMKPTGFGVTVVGDDAQSIYSFRAATVRNILDFPDRFSPAATMVTLEQNYRSTQPILTASNAVIGLSTENHPKNLFSTKLSDEKPQLVGAVDEAAQVDYVVTKILAHREAGIDLKQQAVLFRASHHSAALEIELSRRNIPFVKFGGLKFLEAGPVKDVLSILRWAENPRDAVAAFRVLQLLPGVGPGTARKAFGHLGAHGFHFSEFVSFNPPAAAAPSWPQLVSMLAALRTPGVPWQGQVGLVRQWYDPLMEAVYDQISMRAGDLDKVEQIAATYSTRERFITELTLDPPDATSAEAGPPLLDEDYLTLSTVHSAKGQEWAAVFIINANDGNFPSDLSAGERAQLEEERRLLYVGMTRAKAHLHIVHPHKFYKTQQLRYGDSYVFAPRTRFIPNSIVELFEVRSWPERMATAGGSARTTAKVDVAARMRDMWR